MNNIFSSFKLFVFFTLLTGLFYPYTMIAFGKMVMPQKSEGSLIYEHSMMKGSKLIGQEFKKLTYFTSRKSHCNYETLPSCASQYSIRSKKWLESYQTDLQKHEQQFSTKHINSLNFASASGLDPHITKQDALIQVNSIAQHRFLNHEQTSTLIDFIEKNAQKNDSFFSSSLFVNVLELNLFLDRGL